MISRFDARLLLTARILALILPLCFIAGRVAVDVALSLTVILFVLRSAAARDWSWTRSAWFKIGAGLWLWMLFVSLFAFDSGLSFSQAAPWLRFLIFAAALEAWILDETWMRRLLWVLTGVVVFVALDVWLQYFTGSEIFGRARPSDQRLTGPFNGLRVGIFITKVMFPVILGAFVWRLWRRPAAKAGFIAMTLLLVGAVFVSGERMALLLCLIGLGLAAVVQRGAARAWMVGTLALALVAVVALGLSDPRMLQRHVEQTAETAQGLSDSPYGQIWRSALHLASERPLTGVGMKNFRVACDDPVIGLPEAEVPLRCTTHPHNLYIEWLTEAGVPGLLGFLLLVAVWGRRLWRASRAEPINLWLLGPLVAVAIHLWPLGPSASFFSNWFGGIFWLCMGWALAAARLAEQRRSMR